MQVIRITKDEDWSKPDTVQSVQDEIRRTPGVSAHAALPCIAWSTWQQMAIHKYGAEYVKSLEARREESKMMLKNFIKTAELVISLGGEVSFEWPKSCLGWLLPELIEFITKYNLFVVDVDGCSLGIASKIGEPILKRWRFATTSTRMAESLSKCSCAHAAGFRRFFDTNNTLISCKIMSSVADFVVWLARVYCCNAMCGN